MTINGNIKHSRHRLFVAASCFALLTLTCCSKRTNQAVQSPNTQSSGLLYPVMIRGNSGFINERGEIVVPGRKYVFFFEFHEGLAAFCDRQARFGYVDTAGSVVIQPRFERADSFSEGLAAVVQGKWGYIDTKGRVAIEARFDEGQPFCTGVACVAVGDKYGYIDRQGEFVLRPTFNQAGLFSEGLAPVQREWQGSYEYIDISGKAVIEDKFDEAMPFAEGLAAVEKSGKWGYIDHQGKYAIEPRSEYEYAGSFSEGLADVKVQIPKGPLAEDLDGSEFLDVNGRKIDKPSWLPIWAAGYIDRTGTIVIKPRFSGASAFRGGLASVTVYSPSKKLNMGGYIDRAGEYVWRPSE